MSEPKVPAGPRVFAYLSVKDANAAIGFYTQALGARCTLRLDMPDGSVGHAELAIDGDHNGAFWLADEFPEQGFLSPTSVGHTTVSLSLYVADVDATYARALAAGAKEERPPKDEFFGDRVAKIRDPFGHRWALHQRIETLTAEAVKRRMAEMFGG